MSVEVFDDRGVSFIVLVGVELYKLAMFYLLTQSSGGLLGSIFGISGVGNGTKLLVRSLFGAVLVL